MNKIKIIALCGMAGSGKDTILKNVLKTYPQLHEIVSCTTRPPREGEINGKNYYFISNEEFAQKMYNMEMLECTVFNDWCYGTPLSSLDKNKVNIGVFNLDGLEILLEDSRLDLTIFFVDAPKKTRLLRQLNRENNPDVDEIIRRYQTDEHDFKHIDFRLKEYIYLFNITPQDIEKNTTIIGQYC